MTTPINLNKARKARAKADKKARAEKNIVEHGQSKAARDDAKATESARVMRLDQHKRET